MTKVSRELQLDKRDKFFSDPIFHDILAFDDSSLQTKLDHLRQRCNSNALALANSASPLERSEAAHNLQITCSNDKFMIQLELPGFSPEDFKLKTRDDLIILEASHDANLDNGEEITVRKYTKEFQMPEGVQPEYLTSSYASSGILTIEAPRQLYVPEGAAMEEQLAAKSKAYTTDDGKTAVNEKSQASSQMIAATTESPDGRSKSSMTFSSSSSSASSVITSAGGPNGGSFFTPSLGEGFPSNNGMLQNFPSMQPKFNNFPAMNVNPNFPSMNHGFSRMPSHFPQLPQISSNFPPMSSNFPPMSQNFPQMSLDMDMDSMMKQMMGSMNMRDNINTNARTTSTYDEQRQQHQKSFGSSRNDFMPRTSLGGLPQTGRHRQDIDIEELSNAGSDISSVTGGPAYTVTSPPPTLNRKSQKHHFPEETFHSVAPTADFQTQNDPQSDCTVLLKLREGNEYKLVLNMQQYSPEDITVKLNDDRELTILAQATRDGMEDFLQKHKVPEGIDLEQLSSSFSSDGILVIKAPRVKAK